MHSDASTELFVRVAGFILPNVEYKYIACIHKTNYALHEKMRDQNTQEVKKNSFNNVTVTVQQDLQISSRLLWIRQQTVRPQWQERKWTGKNWACFHGSCKPKGWWQWVVLDCPINKSVLFNLLCALISFLEHSTESKLLNFCSKELQPNNNDDEIMEI